MQTWDDLCCPAPEVVVLGYVNIGPWVLAEVWDGNDTAVVWQAGDNRFETADEGYEVRGCLIRKRYTSFAGNIDNVFYSDFGRRSVDLHNRHAERLKENVCEQTTGKEY